MPPRPDTNDAVVRRAPFGAGWTGALAIGIFVYILLATVLIWRETPHERVERLSQLGTAGVCCPICGYNLTGLSTAQCPECGAKFTLDQLMATQPRERAGV